MIHVMILKIFLRHFEILTAASILLGCEFYFDFCNIRWYIFQVEVGPLNT